MSCIIDDYIQEEKIATACEMATFSARMKEAGLADLLEPCARPRQNCQRLAKATCSVVEYLDEMGQRDMLASIKKSAASYSSGLKCWAAFCDALGVTS